jgi:hypothetical protein
MKTSPLNREQLSILDHTINRACRGMYCGDSPDMQSLVERGLMEFAGRVSFVPDPYFRITAAGREAWKAHQPPPPPIPRRKAREKARYREYLRAECGESFGSWLKASGTPTKPKGGFS